MALVLAADFLHSLLHPLSSGGGTLYGGVLGDVGELAILTGVLGLYYRHMCHVPNCWRLAWHPHPDTGHPVCQHHHPHDPHRDVLTRRS